MNIAWLIAAATAGMATGAIATMVLRSRLTRQARHQVDLERMRLLIDGPRMRRSGGGWQ